MTRRDRLLVLGYHNIEGTWCWPARPRMGERRFGEQMRILSRVATVVDLRSALDTLASGSALPPRAVALTFDDGYRDNLTVAAPILRRWGMCGTIYLVPGLLDRSVHAWWERLGWAIAGTAARTLHYDGREYRIGDPAQRLYAQRHIEGDVKHLDHATRTARIEDLVDQLAPTTRYGADRLFLDWDSAADLARAGLTVGSHTMEHPILARESAETQRRSLTESRQILQDRLGDEVATLAYPNGTRADYDPTTLQAVADAGYSYAVTTWGGRVSCSDPPFEISRHLVSPDMSPMRFAASLAKRFLRD